MFRFSEFNNQFYDPENSKFTLPKLSIITYWVYFCVAILNISITAAHHVHIPCIYFFKAPLYMSYIKIRTFEVKAPVKNMKINTIYMKAQVKNMKGGNVLRCRSLHQTSKLPILYDTTNDFSRFSKANKLSNLRR